MYFSVTELVAFVAAAAVAQGAALTGGKATLPLGKTGTDAIKPADFDVGSVCLNANLGSCGGLNVGAIPSGCRIFVGGFDNAITSIKLNPGITCTFYPSTSCSTAEGFIKVLSGATVNTLAGTNYDNSLSSVACFAA